MRRRVMRIAHWTLETALLVSVNEADKTKAGGRNSEKEEGIG